MTETTATFKDYLELCKPRVVALMVLTAFVAMLLASTHGFVAWPTLFFGLVGIALSAFAGGAINQLLDQRVDAIMARTKRRPLPTGKIKSSQAIIMATLFIIISMFVLVRYVNTLTAVLTFFTMVGYAFIYTLYLKRATPQNIVIGGLAGAMPPLLGWTAVTGHVDPAGLLLVLIIFMWTPPHFWALAIARVEEYAKVDIPMLPVTHGLEYTRINVLVYTILMAAVTYLPIMINMSGLIYGIGVTILNAFFLYYAIKMYRTKSDKDAMKTFRYSIIYLMLLFIVMLVDHYIPLFIR